MSSIKTVTLIGATGFIGRRVADFLLAGGHDVVAAVRPNSRQRAALPPAVKLRECSLSTSDAGLRDTLAGTDAVIYTAGAVRGGCIDDFRPANVDGVEAVADLLERAPSPAPPLLLISSLAAAEPQLSDYAQSKREGELVLESHPQLNSVIFRPPAVYGPGDREMRRLFDLMRRGFALQTGPPRQRLSLLHADDLARAAMAWLDAGPAGVSGSFELHDGHEGGYRFEEIVSAVAPATRVRTLRLPGIALGAVARLNWGLGRLSGRPPMLSPGKARELRHPQWVCDNAAITAAIGWQPEIPLRVGIEDLYS